jgi:hypothetical protein
VIKGSVGGDRTVWLGARYEGGHPLEMGKNILRSSRTSLMPHRASAECTGRQSREPMLLKGSDTGLLIPNSCPGEVDAEPGASTKFIERTAKAPSMGGA